MTGTTTINQAENSLKSFLREQMPVCHRYAYFDHAAVGPIPKTAADAIQKWTKQSSEHGDVDWPEWSLAASELRKNASELIQCQPSEIALVPNTTFGINVIAAGFRWSQAAGARNSVVVLDNEFSSNLLPWLALENRGIEVRRVPVPESGVVDLDRIRKAIDSTTRLVSVSWVGYFTGFRIDLAKLCDIVHEAGSQLFVDAIQGLGVFTLDTDSVPIDYLAADGHKWMLGPEGSGFMFIRQKNLDFLEPLMQGWGSLEASHHFDTTNMVLKTNASRYEGGSANHVGQIGFGQSLKLLLGCGCNQAINPVANAVLDNADRIEQELRAAGANVFRPNCSRDGLSGILTFTLSGRDPIEVRRRLLNENIVLSVRHDRLRVATHAYNNLDDIEQLVRTVRAIDLQQK
jgi:cysteine desulfurase / selenocysteine lyase